MEMIADQDVYILGEHFLEDGQLLIENEFGQDRKQIFTMDDMQLEIDEEEDEAQNSQNPLPLTIKQEPIASTSQDFSMARHFMSSQDDEPEITITNTDDLLGERDENGCLVEHIDIRSPVKTLRPLLEKRLGIDLSTYEYWLQNAQKLEPSKNLVDQCVQGEGLVQINVEILTDDGGNRINIVDVLKPTEDFLQRQKEKLEEKRVDVQWAVDYDFKKNLKQLHIPADPNLWSPDQVKHWIVWAVRQFNLPGIKLTDWNITGKELCEMTFDQFKSKCKNDKNGIFWTHLELLRRCNLFAVVAKTDKKATQTVIETIVPTIVEKPEKLKEFKPGPKRSRILGCNQSVTERKTSNSVKSGTNGQIQLWQFLLELLTDKKHQNVIHWVSSDGQFKLEDPETVARLWGDRKHKPSMTYEKLSRALRYYYDGDMIAKVPGKRFVYKFVCDLKELLGYSAMQLNNLVTECAIKNNLPHASDFIN